MTSLFESIALDESSQRTASRKTVVSASTRVENIYGAWLKAAANNADLRDRLDYIEPEIEAIVAEAASEHGGATPSFEAFYNLYAKPEETARTAAVHESRKPKMCPFHSEVTDISLAQGEPQAGFNAMSQHWGGDKHCQGDGYEGSKCNFKPAMTTQSYWDDKAEKAEERKQQRQDQLEQETQIVEESPVEEQVDEAPEVEALEDSVDTEPLPDNVIEVDFGGAEAETEVPAEDFQVAASTRTADDGLGGNGTAVPKIDKRKWTPETVKHIDADENDGRWPTRHIDIMESIVPQDGHKLEQIGEATTETVKLPANSGDAGFASGGVENGKGGTFPKGNQAEPVTASADADRNPVADLADEFEGFVSDDIAREAIAKSR